MKTYTNAEVNAALKAALELKGEEYVYERGPHNSCDYARNGEPSCIVGHVLHTLNKGLFEKVAEYENGPTPYEGYTFNDVAIALDLPFTKIQVKALRAAQFDQDLGESWGQAAIDYMNVLGETL